MKNVNIFKIFLIFFFNIILLSAALGKISSAIIVKVGGEIITNSDLENEVNTFLVLTKKQINQNNIDKVKNGALKSLIQISIKKNEIKKYKIENYSKEELEKYMLNISKVFQTDRTGLKKIFSSNKIDYQTFLEKTKIELKWKALIYSIYKNQININTIEVENDIMDRLKTKKKNIEYELSEIEIPKNKNNEKYLKEVYSSIKLNGFNEAAKIYSISSSASKGGQIGFFKEEILSKLYLQELKKISTGQFTSPIKNEETIVILKIDSVKSIENNNLDLEKIKEEVIARKKEEKLTLFSKSHFANIQNATLIKFQ